MPDDPPSTPEKAKRPPGRPPHVPTEENRIKVRAWAQALVSQEHMAQFLKIDPTTLRHHYREELDQGVAETIATVSAKYVQLALSGSEKAMRVVLEKRGGWVNRIEHSGPNGKPIEYKDLSETEVEERLRVLEEKYGPRPTHSTH